MFSSSNSMEYRQMRVAHDQMLDRYVARKLQEERIAKQKTGYDFEITLNTASEKIASNLPYFRDILLRACVQYQEGINEKFFRNAGKKRVQLLIANLSLAKNSNDLFDALNTAIAEGNENSDSLKTFLYKSIVDNFIRADRRQIPFLQKDLNKHSYKELLEKIFAKTQTIINTIENNKFNVKRK